ncbi:MAG: hypothetical protein M5U34_01720 [Chloroflexi bacterium]|nr:hypothetical protein [Chloroflexota bacterium]
MLGGKVTLPILVALKENKFKAITSDALLAELAEVVQRPRLSISINFHDVVELLTLLEWYGESCCS